MAGARDLILEIGAIATATHLAYDIGNSTESYLDTFRMSLS